MVRGDNLTSFLDCKNFCHVIYPSPPPRISIQSSLFVSGMAETLILYWDIPLTGLEELLCFMP